MPKDRSHLKRHQPDVSNHADFFTRFATRTARLTGTSRTFMVALGLIILWATTGPFFHFSDTWQLVINTSTTIITFLMVFIIQNTQNRDSEALHLKLDELIRASQGAKNAMIDLEDMAQDELDAFKRKFAQMAREGRLQDPEDFADLMVQDRES